MKKIILKSSSPRRKELMEKLGYKFDIKVYPVDETMDSNLSPFDNVKELSYKKASVKMEEDYGSILIGCDTIVVLDDKIYGKPKDRMDAFNMLKSLSGRCHKVMSGLTTIYKNMCYSVVETSKVYFKELTDDEINKYIDSGECFGKAGAYAIQGLGKELVDHYEGSLNNIIGLPTEKLEVLVGELNEMED